MPSRIAVIAIDAVNPQLVAEFWCNVLAWRKTKGSSASPRPTVRGRRSTCWALLSGRPSRTGCTSTCAPDGVATTDELERLLSLGARRVDIGQGGQGPDVSWVVLGDPEGNEFCLLARSVQEV